MANQETELWKAFRNGEKKAFEALLNTYYDALFNYGMKLNKDHDEVSDDLHDLMINLWERRMYLNPTENLKLYLFKAFRNHIFKKKEKRKTSIITSLDENKTYQDYQVLNSGEFNILEEEVLDENSLRIKHIMQKMSKRQQEILHLRFYENLSNEQIAELLNISRPAVANLLYDSIKKFKGYWSIEFTSILFFMLLIYRYL